MKLKRSKFRVNLSKQPIGYMQRETGKETMMLAHELSVSGD